MTRKTGVLIGALVVTGLVVIFTNPNTNLFKGSALEGEACETEQASYETLHGDVQSSVEAVETLNINNRTLEGYDEREAQIEVINTYLDENPTYNCEEDMDEIIAQLEMYRDVDIAGMQSVLQSAMESMPACPLDDVQHEDYDQFTDFVDIHERIEAGIAELNAKTVWNEDDYDDLKLYVLSMRGLHLTELSGDLTDEQTAEIEATLEDLDIEFANMTIEAYNDAVVEGMVLSRECEGIDVLPLLSAPLECEEGTVFSESSQVCVAVEGDADQCEYNDLFTDMDSIHEILEDAENDPTDFDDDESATVATLLSQFPDEFGDNFIDYIDEIDYEEDANDIIDEMNLIILLVNDEACEKDMLDQLEIESANDEGSNDEGNDDADMCPADASHSVVNDIDICTCDNDASIVEPGGSCEEEEEEEGDDDDGGLALFLCLDGETEVTDPLDCQSFSDDVVDENTNDDETDPANFFPAATDPGTIAVNQGSNIDLTTNTNPNIMNAPEVQGNTGPGMLTSFLLFLSVLAGNILRSLSII